MDKILFFLFMVFLIPVSIRDIRERKIKNKSIILALLAYLGLYFLYFLTLFLSDDSTRLLGIGRTFLINILISLLVFVIFSALSIVSRGGLGMGDVKLIFISALYLGWRKAIFLNYLALVFILVLGLSILLKDKLIECLGSAKHLKGRSKKTGYLHFPYAPFLLLLMGLWSVFRLMIH